MLLVHGKTAGWMASGNSALMTKAHVKSLSENEAPISGSTPAANKYLFILSIYDSYLWLIIYDSYLHVF